MSSSNMDASDLEWPWCGFVTHGEVNGSVTLCFIEKAQRISFSHHAITKYGFLMPNLSENRRPSVVETMVLSIV